jgi:large subunit ribosomal protein L9
MKVILKKAVLKLGNPGQIVEAAPGYIFNFLVPKGLGMPVNKENLIEFEKKKEEILKEHEALKNNALQIKEAMEGKPVFLAKTVNEAGNFYSSLQPEEVINALNAKFQELKLQINKQQISLPGIIRSFGIYDLTVILYNAVSASLKLVIDSTIAGAEELFLKPPISKKPRSSEKQTTDEETLKDSLVENNEEGPAITAEEDIYTNSASEIEDSSSSENEEEIEEEESK